jgi:hypothetical protein
VIGQGVRKSKHDLTEEIRSLEDDRYPRDLRELIAKAYGEPIHELEGEPL